MRRLSAIYWIQIAISALTCTVGAMIIFRHFGLYNLWGTGWLAVFLMVVFPPLSIGALIILFSRVTPPVEKIRKGIVSTITLIICFSFLVFAIELEIWCFEDPSLFWELKRSSWFQGTEYWQIVEPVFGITIIVIGLISWGLSYFNRMKVWFLPLVPLILLLLQSAFWVLFYFLYTRTTLLTAEFYAG